MNKEKTKLQNNEEYYCLNCGTAQKGNTVVRTKTKDRILTCSDCEIQIRFYVMSPPKKTVAEAAKSFDATPLTDRQTGHKPYTKRRKSRKNK